MPTTHITSALCWRWWNKKAKEPWAEAKCSLFYSMWVFIGSQHYTFWGLTFLIVKLCLCIYLSRHTPHFPIYTLNNLCLAPHISIIQQLFLLFSTKCRTKILAVTLKNLVLWPESSWPDLNMRVLGQLLEEA